MKWQLLCVFLLSACGGGLQRQACYAAADSASWAEAERVCKLDTQPWDDCPERARILKELEASYGRCP
jgi:hypothetical protein